MGSPMPAASRVLCKEREWGSQANPCSWPGWFWGHCRARKGTDTHLSLLFLHLNPGVMLLSQQ